MKSDGPAVATGGVRGSIRAGPVAAPLKIDTAAAAAIDLEHSGGVQQGVVAQSGR